MGKMSVERQVAIQKTLMMVFLVIVCVGAVVALFGWLVTLVLGPKAVNMTMMLLLVAMVGWAIRRGTR